MQVVSGVGVHFPWELLERGEDESVDSDSRFQIDKAT